MHIIYKQLQRIYALIPTRKPNTRVQVFKTSYTSQRCTSSSNVSISQKWNHAIMEAEKCVGYSAIISGSKTVSDYEPLVLVDEIRKLLGSNHPLLKTVTKLIYNNRVNLHIRSLIIMLAAKVAGVPKKHHSHSEDVSIILSNQKRLAHITDVLHFANCIHQRIINLSSIPVRDEANVSDIVNENKTAILVGDYLLARSCVLLSEMSNTEVFAMMALANKNCVEAEFVFEQDKSGKPYPTALTTVRDWETKTYLSCGSLLAHSCVSAMLLAAHDKTIQQAAFKLGKQFGLTWQVFNDLQPFVDDGYYRSRSPFELFSLPIILHLQRDPSILDLILPHANNLETVNYFELWSLVNNGPSINEAKQLGKKYARDAANVLQHFNKESEAKEVLENIINSMVAD